MRLNRLAREVYTVNLVLSPPVTGTWEATFDGGSNWIAGTDLGSDNWGWLVAGPDNTGGSPVHQFTAGETTIVPLLRITSGNEEIVVSGPYIEVVAS